MDIGTFTIDNYTQNGSSGYDLARQISLADNFYLQGKFAMSNFLPCFTPVNRLSYKRDAEVTASILTDNFSGTTGDRESNDFIFYAGHQSRGSGTQKPSCFSGATQGMAAWRPARSAWDRNPTCATAISWLTPACFFHLDAIHPLRAIGGTFSTGCAPCSGSSPISWTIPWEIICLSISGNAGDVTDNRYSTHSGLRSGTPGIGAWAEPESPACLSAAGSFDYCQKSSFISRALQATGPFLGAGSYHSAPVDEPSYP